MTATVERENKSGPPAPEDGSWCRQLVESLPQLVWTATPDGHYDYLSPPWAEYTGVPAADLLGSSWLALVHPADRDGLHQTWSVASAAGSPFGAEFRLRGHDGAYRWFEVRAMPLCDTRGRIERWFGANTDIEDRRLADAAREESEKRLDTVLDSMSEGVVMGDVNGELRCWNRAALAMHDYSSVDEGVRAIAKFAATFELRTLEGAVLPPEAWPLDRILHGEAVRDATVRMRRTDRPWDRILSYSGTQLRQLDGRTLAFVTISDVTDRYEAIQARLESEEQLRLANEAAGIGTYDIDFAVGHIRYSPEMCALLGVDGNTEHPLDESLGFVHPDDAEDFDRLFATARDPAGTGTAHGEHRFVHSSGEVRWAAWSARTSFGSTPDGRRPVRTVGAYVDVTEPRRAERRLATQNAVSRSLVAAVVTGEAVPEIIRCLCESEGWDLGAYWEVDSGSGLLRCADLWHRDDTLFAPFIDATRALTFEHGEGLPGRVWSTAAPIMIEDVGRDPTYERAEAALEAGLRSAVAFPIVVRGEVSGVLDFVGRGVVGRDGEPLEMLAAIGRHLGLYFDRKRAEAERQELEGQLRQSQRMEAIGALSGGIAHDFNNILGAIVGNVELALEDVGEGHPAVQSLSAISQASQHARELVQQILTFAQQGRVERRVVSLAPVAAESVGMLRATLPAGVELTLQCDPDCPLVLADVTQMQQVIVNLGTNAWHALQDRAGTIEVSLAAVTVDEAQARRLPGLRPGHCALLTVSDTGNGIDATMLERIFDPFFTTKAHGNGNGTGLGLSVVHGIVQRHEGAILVSSVLGRGSSFEIYLPAVDGQATDASDWTPRSSLLGHGEHVLFVDYQEPLAVAEQ